MVVAVATVTVPFTLVASPVILLNISSNLALSVEPVTICLKNTLFVLKPTFSVDNPIKSSFIFTQNNLLKELKLKLVQDMKYQSNHEIFCIVVPYYILISH